MRKIPFILAGVALAMALLPPFSRGLATPQFPGLETLHYSAPEFPPPGENVSGTTWLNSPPLTFAGLRGKVMMVDFWEYTCINCIRTFDQNKIWYERYHKLGFEIVGVHDPEFDIAYPVENVREAAQRFGLPYPIVVDDWYTIWKAWKNHTWPSRFLVDAQGVVRYHRSGEGADGDFERAIRELLTEVHPGIRFPATEKLASDEDAFAPRCGVSTDEMYMGTWYGRGVLENSQGYHPGKITNYKLPADVLDGRSILSGRWETDLNGMIYRGKEQGTDQTPGEKADRLEMRYHARELYSVMNVSRGKPSRIYILQDGKNLTSANRGVDVQIDAHKNSYIEVNLSRMYYLVANPSFGSHRVTLIPTAPGLTVNSFVFGNDCQTRFSHQ